MQREQLLSHVRKNLIIDGNAVHHGIKLLAQTVLPVVLVSPLLLDQLSALRPAILAFVVKVHLACLLLHHLVRAHHAPAFPTAYRISKREQRAHILLLLAAGVGAPFRNARLCSLPQFRGNEWLVRVLINHAIVFRRPFEVGILDEPGNGCFVQRLAVPLCHVLHGTLNIGIGGSGGGHAKDSQEVWQPLVVYFRMTQHFTVIQYHMVRPYAEHLATHVFAILGFQPHTVENNLALLCALVPSHGTLEAQHDDRCRILPSVALAVCCFEKWNKTVG